MKLSRITKIRGYRVFREFAWPRDLHAFGRFNLIYGWNGCGKTTLSSLLALIEQRGAPSVGEVELEFDGSSKVTGTELTSASLPQVRVFNRDFVNATLQSAGGIAPIFFLGKQSIEKQARVAELKAELATVESNVAEALTAQKVADERQDEYCRNQAKLIKDLLTASNSTTYNNYDKRRFKTAMQEHVAAIVKTTPTLDPETRAKLRSQKDAQPKPRIDRIRPQPVDLEALSKDVAALVGRSVAAETLSELTSDAKLAFWVQQGLSLHPAKHGSSTCRFCDQPFTEARRRALEAHFNDAFARFEADLAALVSKLGAEKKKSATTTLPDESRFYDHLSAEAVAEISAIRTATQGIEAILDALIARLEAKRQSPFAPTFIDSADRELPRPLDDAVTALNVIIDKHNETSDDFRRSVEDACRQLEAAYVADARADYVSLEVAAREANTSYRDAGQRTTELRAAIEAIEREIKGHLRAADELNMELRAYLGRDELRFEVKGGGYALTRGGEVVSHLSEGERTAITFLYFLKSLEDLSFNKEDGIVVIDDPVSSLDANALFSAFGYMQERTRRCGQLFILTHNFSFFRLVREWFKHESKKDVRQFQLRSRRQADGTRTSQIEVLDSLLRNYESEYQYLFKRVYEEAHRSGVSELEHHYGLPNVARRLIEAFLSFRFPDMSGDLRPRLERVNFDSAKKIRILRLLNTYSHARAVSEPEHDLSLLAETQPALLDVLEMMRTVDRDHFEGLEKVVNAKTTESVS